MPRLTFDYVSDLASEHGFTVERSTGGYELFSNERMPGVIAEEERLADIYSELYYRIFDADGKLLPRVPVRPEPAMA